MITYKLTTASGGVSKESVELEDSVFNKKYNETLIHQVVTAYMAKSRAGTRAHQNRAAVRGGGAKPWRQKGTGRARAGSIRSPIWRGGGKTFAAVPADYSQKVNKKMYRSAMCSILSELVRSERLTVITDFKVSESKTKLMASKLKSLGLNSVLIVTAVAENDDEKLYLSSRNIHRVEVCNVNSINPVALIKPEKVVMTLKATKQLNERLA